MSGIKFSVEKLLELKLWFLYTIVGGWREPCFRWDKQEVITHVPIHGNHSHVQPGQTG